MGKSDTLKEIIKEKSKTQLFNWLPQTKSLYWPYRRLSIGTKRQLRAAYSLRQ